MLIAVHNENVFIENRSCRQVRLPDGRPGAIWRGIAYVIRPDGVSIDVASLGIPPGLCGKTAGLEASRIPYSLIEGATEAYLLIVGSVVECQRTISTLTAEGFTVLRSGRYLGETIDGLSADWFIRLVTPAKGFAALRKTIDEMLGMRVATPAASEGAEMRVALLAAELTAARVRETHDRTEIDRLRAALAERVTNDSELAAMRVAFDDERKARLTLEAAAAPTPAQSALSAAPPRLSKRLGEEVADVVAVLLPRVVFIRDSETLIAAEFANRRRLYAALHELEVAAAAVSPNWKTLKGAGKWIERHVSNGHDDSGRIYARRRADDDRWDVLVSHKGEQARDISWLKEKT